MQQQQDLRPLSPRTQASYQRLLERAFGTTDAKSFGAFTQDVTRWPGGCRSLLRAAVKRACEEQGVSTLVMPILARIPRNWDRARPPRVPAEAELLEYERQAKMLPPGRRGLALIPLATGLRAEELLTLTRDQVRRAAKFGELTLTRKGGEEQILTVARSAPLFEELLTVEACRGSRLNQPKRRTWEQAGHLLSPGIYISQYHEFRKLVQETGEKAGIEKFRPHLLRHAFATRLNLDRAPLQVIQYALGHAHVSTTSKYVHVAAAQMTQYMRNFSL